MTRKDLFDRIRQVAVDNGDEGKFDTAYPNFSTWESENFKSQESVVKVLNKLKNNNVLSSDWTIEKFYPPFVCDLAWAKSTTYCGGSTPPLTQDDYAGEYKLDLADIKFKIEKSGSNYVLKAFSVDIDMKDKSGDEFTLEKLGQTGKIKFTRNSTNAINGGEIDFKVKISLLEKEIKGKFTKVGSTVTPTPDPVKDSCDDTSAFACIEKFMCDEKYPNLLVIDNSTRYEKVKISSASAERLNVDKSRKFRYVYKDDKKFLFTYDDGSKETISRGKWYCNPNDEKSFFIQFEGGEPICYGKKCGQTPVEPPKPTETDACTSYNKTCPSIYDIAEGKQSLKICTRCELVEDIQNQSDFNKYYFEELTKNNKPQKVDNIFGKIMESAMKKYQKDKGLKDDGVIGKDTIKKLFPWLEENIY